MISDVSFPASISAPPSTPPKAMAFAAILLAAAACGEAEAPGGAAEPERAGITLAVAAQPISAPVFVAAARGFFAQEGLDAELVHTPTGETALREVIRRRADFATTAETPVVHAALDGDSVVVLGTVATTRQGLVLMTRRDRGVETPGDLAGRRIGVTLETNAEFFLDLFLTLHGVRRDSVELVATEPRDLVPALTLGRVDAVVAWEPHRSAIRRRLGSNVHALSSPAIYTWFWNVVARKSFSDAHPRTAAALLRALRAAQEFIVANPDRSRTTVSRRLDRPAEEMAAGWEETSFIVSLDQALVVAMEDQARWLLAKRGAPAADLPNVLRFIAPGPLGSVAPDAVSIPGERSPR